MEGRSYFWKMAAVCVLVSAVLLTGCGGTGSPADDPGFDERIFGTWEREFATHHGVWEIRCDGTIVSRGYTHGDGTFMFEDLLTFTVNADVFILTNVHGDRLYHRFSRPDVNTLVMFFFRVVEHDATIHEIPDAVAMTWRRVTQ